MSDTTQTCEDQHRQAINLFRQGSYREAADVLDEVLGSLETSEIWNDWATAQLMCSRIAESERGYRHALSMDPANTLAAGNLGVLLSSTGRVAEAVPLLKRAAEASSGRERDALLHLLRLNVGQKFPPREVSISPAAGNSVAAGSVQASVPLSYQARRGKAGVYFRGLIYGGSGYAEEARVEMLGLSDHQIQVQLVPLGTANDADNLLPSEPRRRLEILQRQTVDLDQSVFLQYSMPSVWDMDTYGRWCVVRTMFETDGLPAGVRERCNRMDEIWVPSRFNLETYAQAGVKEGKLRLVPAGVDTQLFRPGATPLPVPRKRGFNFLSIFDWQLRKGYDALLLAYLQEFKPDEDVALILKVSQLNDPLIDLETHLAYFVEGQAGLPLEKAPPVILINGFIPQQEMPRLYTTSDCFVLPTRGEGYGRPFMEALACQLPVIATGWGGQADFLTCENCHLIDHRVVPVPDDVDIGIFAGQRWAEPDVDHLRHLMRQVFSNKAEAMRRAERGRADMVQQYDWNVIIPRWVSEFRRLLD